MRAPHTYIYTKRTGVGRQICGRGPVAFYAVAVHPRHHMSPHEVFSSCEHAAVLLGGEQTTQYLDPLSANVWREADK